MEGPTLLPLPEGARMTGIRQQETVLIIAEVSERASAQCPLCGELSDAVHSRYQRWLKDVPCEGQAVRLHFTVRKFFFQIGVNHTIHTYSRISLFLYDMLVSQLPMAHHFTC